MMAHRTAQRLRRFLLAAASCGVIAAFFPFASPASASAAEASAETASPAKAAAGPADALRQMHDLPVDSIERYWNDLLNEYGGYFPERRRG